MQNRSRFTIFVIQFLCLYFYCYSASGHSLSLSFSISLSRTCFPYINNVFVCWCCYFGGLVLSPSGALNSISIEWLETFRSACINIYALRIIKTIAHSGQSSCFRQESMKILRAHSEPATHGSHILVCVCMCGCNSIGCRLHSFDCRLSICVSCIIKVCSHDFRTGAAIQYDARLSCSSHSSLHSSYSRQRQKTRQQQQ